MSAIGLLLIGIGSYLMYDAVKNSTPTPITNAKASLAAVSGSSSASSSSETNTIDQAA